MRKIFCMPTLKRCIPLLAIAAFVFIAVGLNHIESGARRPAINAEVVKVIDTKVTKSAAASSEYDVNTVVNVDTGDQTGQLTLAGPAEKGETVKVFNNAGELTTNSSTTLSGIITVLGALIILAMMAAFVLWGAVGFIS